MKLMLRRGTRVEASLRQGYMRHKVALAQFASWFTLRDVEARGKRRLFPCLCEVYVHYSLESYGFEARKAAALPAVVMQVDCYELTAAFEKEVKPILEEVLQMNGLYCALTSREASQL